MTPKTDNKEIQRVAGVCVFLVLAVWAVFGQTARFEFVNYDDPAYVYDNPMVQQGLTWKGVLWALTYGEIGHWHPLTWLTHMADCQMFGLWAGGPHLVNVALHAATVVLLFLVLHAMTGSLWRSAFVAAVFGVHPLRAESVAWIAERKDVLSGMFFMLTLLAYARYARQPSRGRYQAVVCVFAVGLLAKNILVTLPFVLLLLDYWPLGRLRNRRELWGLFREKIPLFLLSAGSCIATSLVPEKIGVLARVPFQERAGNAIVSYIIYLRQMFFPSGLAIPYPYPGGGTRVWQVCVAWIALCGVTAAAVAWRRKRPYLLVGWLWYLGMFAPMIGIAQISYYAHADRYTYLPEIGVAIALIWAAASWISRRAILVTLMAAVLGILMVAGHRQTSYWRGSESLWTHALECIPDNSVAYFNLGAYRAAKGRNDEAIALYRKALEINPNYAEAMDNLGIALYGEGKKEEAIAQYRKALEINPDYAEALGNLGVALFEKGEKEEAIAQYRRAVNIKPDYAEARSNLGYALLDKGEKEEAVAQYREALEIDPKYVKAEYNWGNALASEGKLDEAIAHLSRAVNIKPDYANAYASLGLVYFEKGEIRDAVHAWQQALALKPDQADIQNNLAWLLATASEASIRDGAKAVALAERANQLNGGRNAAVLHTLAAAYAEAGRFEDAAATARRALELATAQKNDDLTARLPKELELYEASKPVRNVP
jgi:protein O-mannosyl-transferase